MKSFNLPWSPIPNVPIVFPKAVAGQTYIHMPLIPGDDVVMVISERSLDNWKQTGTLSNPDDRKAIRYHGRLCIPWRLCRSFVVSPDDPMAVEIKNILGMCGSSHQGNLNIKML